MDKASNSKNEYNKTNELEAINVAIVNSMAGSGPNMNVNVDILKKGLQGIVEEEGRLAIRFDNAPWTVIGKTGTVYTITSDGTVTSE